MSAAPLMLASLVMMMRWSGLPELNSRRDSSCCLGLVSSLMFTRIPQRVKCVGGDFRCSGSSKWPENISDSGPASWDFSSFNLPLRASVRKTQTKSWNWKPKRNDILFFARVCQLLVRLEPILPRVVREYLIISCLRCCLNMTVRLPGATQLLWDRYFPWEISTLTTTTGQRDQWRLKCWGYLFSIIQCFPQLVLLLLIVETKEHLNCFYLNQLTICTAALQKWEWVDYKCRR